jgi:hypothetical protein
LRRREPLSLAAFIVSLAQKSGPIGEHIRTFIVGDDLGEAAESAAKNLPRVEVEDGIKALMEDDRYAVWGQLRTILSDQSQQR